MRTSWNLPTMASTEYPLLIDEGATAPMTSISSEADLPGPGMGFGFHPIDYTTGRQHIGVDGWHSTLTSEDRHPWTRKQNGVIWNALIYCTHFVCYFASELRGLTLFVEAPRRLWFIGRFPAAAFG